MTDFLNYTGTPSVLFDELERGDFEALKHLEIVADYGAYGKDEEGNEVVLFQWQDGGRKLVRAKDGSLFLIQTSVVYGEDSPEEERDWYQVESEKQAEWLNAHVDGQKLAYRFKGPKIWSGEGRIHYRLTQGE